MTDSGNFSEKGDRETHGLETEPGVDARPASQDADEGVAASPEPDVSSHADEHGHGSGPASPDTPSIVDDSTPPELAVLRGEFDDLNDRHLRLVAEFNNFKRRSEQERLAAWARAQSELAGRLVEVLDDLQRVAQLDLSNATVEVIMEGIDLVERKFARALTEAGIEVIEPSGMAFDPNLMEAMMRVPAESEEQIDQVAQVFQKGYQLKGNLIRPARVSVFTQS
jgi:molecular chaperone GrpE